MEEVKPTEAASTPDTSDLAPTITILRGIHDAPMVEALAPTLRKMDAVFLECLTDDPEERKRIQNVFYNLCFDDTAATHLSDAEVEASGSIILRLAWAMRQSRVPVFTVDSLMDKTPEQLVGMFKPIDDRLLIALFKSGDLEQYYRTVDARLTKLMLYVIKRDKLVASQVAAILKAYAKKSSGRKLQQVAVVQGWMHYSKAALQRELPAATVRQTVFGRERLDTYLKVPLHQAMRYKREHMRETLPRGLADRLLLHNHLLAGRPITDAGAPPAGDPLEFGKKMQADMLADDGFMELVTQAEKLSDLSDEAVHEKVLELLQRGIGQYHAPKLL